MLALQPPQQGKPLDSKKEQDSSSSSSLTCRCTPNILPCRIHHDGLLDSTLERYWKPTIDGNGDDASAGVYLPFTDLNVYSSCILFVLSRVSQRCHWL